MILAADFMNAWGPALGRASWQAGIVVLVVWGVCRVVPSMPARFQSWLWRIALLKFLVLLIWTAPIALPILPAPAPTAPFADTPVPLPATAIPREAMPMGQTRQLVSPWLILFLAWMTVVLWQAARIATAFRSARRLRSACRPITDAKLLGQLGELSRSAGLRWPPALLEMDAPGSPLLVGLLHPAIVLPSSMQNRLSNEEREVVFSHELAHVCRGDLFWSLLAVIVRVLFFFHPLAWLAERRLRLTQEIAADELAIAIQQREPASYAAFLVSVVGKFGPAPLLPTLSVGVAGSHRSLKQRLLAMRFMKPASRRILIAYGIVLALVAGLGLVPWTLVAAQAPAEAKIESKVESKAKPAPQSKTERGRFVSFKDGTVTIQHNSGALSATRIVENTTILVWDNSTDKFMPATAAQTLDRVEPNTWTMVYSSPDQVTLRFGSRKAQTVGTFVSYKDDRLLILGKNLGESYIKKYGNNVHFNKFRADTPIYESIDGSEHKLVGLANKILPSVREGTILTVHGQGDDNILRVDIGVRNKNN